MLLSKRRTTFSTVVIAAACVLLIAGFCLPWFSSPDAIHMLIGDGPFRQSVPEQVSGLNMLFGGTVYAVAYAPSLVPEVFALLWLLPVCALLLTGLALAELFDLSWGTDWARWVLSTLLFVLMGILLGPIIIGPTGPAGYEGNRLFGLWITFAGFLLLLLSRSLLVVRTVQKRSSAAQETKQTDQQTPPLSRRRVLSSLLSLAAIAPLGTGSYLLRRLWAARHTLESFPLLTSSQQPPAQIGNEVFPVPRMGRVAWSSDGKRVFTFANVAYYPGSRDAFSGTHLRTYLFPTQDFALSLDSQYLALLDPRRGTPAIVRTQDGIAAAASWTQQVLATAATSCLAWSPDGKRIAIGGSLQKPNVPTIEGAGLLCYDVFSRLNQQTYRTGVPGGGLRTVAWSPNGRYLAGAGSADVRENGQLLGYVFVWEAESGQVLFKAPANSWSSIAWSPESHHLAVAHENIVEVWVPSSGRKSLEYHEHLTEVWSLAWSPDGTHIASASDADGLVHVWETSTGRLRYLYQGHVSSQGHASTVTDISWSPNSAYLLTCDEQHNVVHIWQPQI